MFGVRHINSDAMTYVIHYKKGQIIREGQGLSFFYYEPNSTIVSVFIGSIDVPFKIHVSTMDYQNVTILGQISYKVEHPLKLVQLMDFSVDHKGRYKKKDNERVHTKFINEAQTAAMIFVQGVTLKGALQSARMIEEVILEGLISSKMLTMLGVIPLNVSVFSIKPSPEVENVMQTQTNEAIQQDALQAIYDRKYFQVEQERRIKESEINSELLLAEKKKQVKEKKMDDDYIALHHSRRMKEMQLEIDISMEEQKRRLIEITTDNNKRMANSNSYLIDAILLPLRQSQRYSLYADKDDSFDPAANAVEILRELAENAARLGTLYITPDLLQSLLSKQTGHGEENQQ
ncbi:MAG: membrane protease subunit, stomatin/prohibitin [Nitrospirae bacterium]|nr:membrane protease subunit, stomatin/prohibitin [Nitrospirota bacterium]